MTALFYRVLLASGLTSLVIGALWLFRGAFRRSCAPGLRRLVFLAIALRLLLPIQLELPAVSPALPAPQWAEAEWIPLAGLIDPEPEAQPDKALVPERGVHPAQAAAVVWFAVAAGLFGRQLLGSARYVKDLRSGGIPLEEGEIRAFQRAKERLGGCSRVVLTVSTMAQSPMLTGFFRPVVVLPCAPFPEGQLELIFLHELEHYKQKDLWMKLALTAAQCLHWFNPLVGWMADWARKDIEAACDDRVLAQADGVERRAYGRTILAVMEGGRGETLMAHLTGGAGEMKERFQNILCPMGRTAGRGIALLAAGGLALGMFVGCAAPVPQEASSPEVHSQAVDGAPSQEEIAQLLETDSSSGQAPADGWVFPLKGQEDCFLSSPYGWRNQATDLHNGVDLVKKGEDFYGEEILAANAGKVVYAKDNIDEPGRGYGRYVVLDHGGDVTTLYAQCSEILVAQGDEVTAGQPIAKVGSSGYSTGPHLHFELRKNGERCDPLQLYAPVEKVETAAMAGHLASYLTGKTGEKVTADQLEEGRLEEIRGVSAYAYRLGEEGYAIASREEGGFATYRYDPQAGEWQGMDLFFPF